MKKSEALIYLLSASIIVLSSIILANFPFLPLRTLPILSFELSFPSITWVVWVYLSLCFYCLYLFKIIFTSNNAGALFKQLLIYNLIILFINAAYPIAFPREFYPIPLINDLSHNLLTIIRHVNQPVGTAPSILICNCFVMTSMVFSGQKVTQFFIYAFLILGSCSLILLKQNYLLGIGLTFLCSLIFIFMNKRKIVL